MIKVGGGILEDDLKRKVFLEGFSKLKGSKILIHGGGRLADKFLSKMGIKVHMEDGRRITDESTLEVITMVYGGLVNKKLVAELQALNQNAIGLSGADLNLIESEKRASKPIDFGFVGDIKSVNQKGILNLLSQGLIPVIAPLTHDKKGQLLNTNADTIASEVAKSVSTQFNTQLIYCFELEGVLDGKKNVIEEISNRNYEALKQENAITGGMIPKLDNAFLALQAGISEVLICKYSALEALEGTKVTI